MSIQRYDVLSPRQGKEGKIWWIRIGAAFPAKDGGSGFTIALDALPIPDKDGKVFLKVAEPKQDERQ